MAVTARSVGLAGLVGLFVAGLPAVALGELWAPLALLFWPAWPVVAWWLLPVFPDSATHCSECLSRVRMGANRCWRCGSYVR